MAVSKELCTCTQFAIGRGGGREGDTESPGDRISCHTANFVFYKYFIVLFPDPDKLGLEDGSIPDASLSASSNYKGHQNSITAGCRLNKRPTGTNIGAWTPNVKDTNQWIQVDLDNPTYVTGVLTQGRFDDAAATQWVTKYKVQFEPPSPACLIDVKDQLGQTQVC